uniref:F-box domain-containing protein n=1 Tax=Aegilops tauschii subsp. strangulata TaxID=200361 RepID=A0A453Q5F9_AEGTS
MAKPSDSTMGVCNPDDRISSLPNGVLVNILDRLDVRAAARTSVLSRRWSQLPAMLSRLTISPRDFLPSETKISIFHGELVRTTAAAVAKDLANAAVSNVELVRRTDALLSKALADTTAVAKAVAKVAKSTLARRDPGGWPIRLLSMTFYLIDNVPISVGHAVGSAMATCKVEKAEFTVLTEKGRLECTIDDSVKYGARFVSFFNECTDTFAGLTRLYLANLRFAESEFVSNILVTCKRLKYLGFLNCNTESWIAFQIEHAELSELSIFNCRFDVVKLDWVPKLTWLVFECWMSFKEPPLSFGYVPLLDVLSVSNVALSWHEMVELSTLLHETFVRDLSLGFKCEKIWVQPECPTRRV